MNLFSNPAMNFTPANIANQNDSEQQEDFFSGLFENRKSKIVCLLFSSVGSCIVMFLFYCVIWYNHNGYDSKRTTLNRLYCACWCWALMYILTVHQVNIVRYIIGPLPKLVCQANYFAKRCITLGGVLTMGFIMVIRYIFIFWLKNPAAFEDEFWSLFLNVWTILFTLTSELVLIWLPGKDNFDIYICTGADPSENQDLSEKNSNFSVAIKAVSLGLQFVIMARIQIYKLKIWRDNPVNKPMKFAWLSKVESFSAAETLITSSPLILVFFAFLLQLSRPQTDFYKMNEYPSCLREYTYTLIRPVLVGLLLALYQYKRDKESFIFPLNEFKSMLLDYFH